MASEPGASIIVLDCGSSMAGQIDSGPHTKLDLAKTLVLEFLQQKILLAPTDQVGVILLGTEGTDNEMHDEHHGGYVHISVRNLPEPPLVPLAKEIAQLKATETAADCFEGLIVATDLLDKCDPNIEDGKAHTQKTVFLFTDGGAEQFSDLRENASQFADVYKGLMHVPIVIFMQGRDNVLLPHQLETKQFLIDFCAEAGGKVLSHDQATEEFRTKQPQRVKQRTKARLEMTLPGDIKIPVYIYVKTTEQPLPSLKSETSTGQAVRVERAFLRTENDGAGGLAGEEIPKENTEQGFLYGKDLVIISPLQKSLLEYESGERSLKILGVIGQSEIPRRHVTDKTEVVAACPTNEAAKHGLSDLITALSQLDCALLGRYVYQKNAPTRFVLLTPCTTNGCLYLNGLPFAEDIRELSFKSFPVVSPSEKQVVGELIDKMMLLKPPAQPKEQEKELYNPDTTYNPTLQKFYRLVIARAMNPDVTLDQLHLDDLNHALDRDPWIIEQFNSRITEVSEGLKKVFKLQPVPSEAKSRKRAFRDTFEKQAPRIDLLSINVEEGVEKDSFHKEHEERAAKKQAAIHELKIGTSHPAEDFRKAIELKDFDITYEAFEQLEAVVKRLVKEGGVWQVPKALECIEAMRAEGISGSANLRFNQFNEFISSFRQLCFERINDIAYQKIWNSIVDRALTLISNEEAEGSPITSQEAKEFLLSNPSVLPSGEQLKPAHLQEDLDELE